MNSLDPNLQTLDRTSVSYLVPTTANKLDVIVTIIATSLLIVATALVIHYALNPIHPLVRITADLSLSLPVVVCGSAGGALVFFLGVQICRHKGVARSGAAIRSSITRSYVHLGARPPGKSPEQYAIDRKESIQKAAESIGKRVTFKTRDGVTLGGFWHMKDPCLPTVLLFLGQNEKADWECKPWGWFYKEYMGFNVLITDYRGYGLSDGQAGGPNQEYEAYLDAEAAYNFVSSQGIALENMIAHGFSLGGAYAAALGYFFGVPYVILDHTFTSIADVCANKVPFLPWQTLISSSYLHYEEKKGPFDLIGRKSIKTDGFNTLNKVSEMSGDVYVISGKNDKVAPISFGERLVEGRYTDTEEQASALLLQEGGHEARGKFITDFFLKEGKEREPADAAFEHFWQALWKQLGNRFDFQKNAEGKFETIVRE